MNRLDCVFFLGNGNLHHQPREEEEEEEEEED